MSALRGSTALVTGGASGIGWAVADVFARAGAAVVVLDVSPNRPDTLAPEWSYVCADIQDTAAVDAAVAAAVALLGGRLDILVNNAGVGAQGTVETSSDRDWYRVLDVNVVGTARVSRAAWPHLAASSAGAIVNTASIVATVGLPNRVVYAASKGAVLALTRAMAADGLAAGIRVNCVSPGTADTPWVGRLLNEAADPAEERRALEARQPHGRLVDAREVAGAVLYLASPASGSTTAADLVVDGGLTGVRVPPRVS
jgi:NAD(P)-dependent dehydrogenase (short-subunit alcohol dehydrogenase family)